MYKGRARRGGIGTIFTLMLFLVFVLCSLFTVLIGAKVYENINVRNNSNYDNYIILDYVANKVRQSDSYDNITVEQVEGTSVLKLYQEAQGSKYVTWIYEYEGNLKELFIKEDSTLSLPDGLDITKCEKLDIDMDGRVLSINSGGDTLNITINSDGRWSDYEE